MQDLAPAAYRSLVLDDGTTPVGAAWNALMTSDPSLWERISRDDDAFHLDLASGERVALSAISDAALVPDLPRLGWLGRLMTRTSLGARILSARRGCEEVTFYCLIGREHGRSAWQRFVDRFVIRLAAPPLNWRRLVVVREVRRALLTAIRAGSPSFALLDVGCGGGFDGLDLERILFGLARALPEGPPLPEHRILDVDIDDRWIGNNAVLTERLYGSATRVRRHLCSAFDYVGAEENRGELAGVADLFVSCNGFSDFLDLPDLEALFRRIAEAAECASRRVTIVLPVALRNAKQEFAAASIGFGYPGKQRADLEKLIALVFPGYAVHWEEAHAQGIFVLVRQ